MIMCFKTATEPKMSFHPLGEIAYAFDCTLLRRIDLTTKALRRMTMSGLSVGATEPKKCTLKRVQLRMLGSKLKYYAVYSSLGGFSKNLSSIMTQGTQRIYWVLS